MSIFVVSAKWILLHWENTTCDLKGRMVTLHTANKEMLHQILLHLEQAEIRVFELNACCQSRNKLSVNENVSKSPEANGK